MSDTLNHWILPDSSRDIEREIAAVKKERDDLRERADKNVDLLIGALHDFATFYRERMTHGMLETIEDTLASLEPKTSLAEWNNDYKH